MVQRKHESLSKSSESKKLIVGTRGSTLARAQTGHVVHAIKTANPGLEVETRIIRTTGDELQGKPLPEIGGKGLFTEQLEQALADGSIDLAVHSAKDLPTDLAEGLDVLAFPKREDARDAWISQDGRSFSEVEEGATVGTSSLRRQAQLLQHRPDLSFVSLRGNVDTRIKKIHRGDCDGAVLAMAGLKRAELVEHVTHPFEQDFMLSAPGQGALALEGRLDDERVNQVVAAVHHEPTAIAVRIERSILSELDAGCRAPVAVYAQITEDRQIQCSAWVGDPAGKRTIHANREGVISDVADLVSAIVAELRDAGADEIIAACRS
jgi:hydroxymethylbilane synthase